MQREVIVEVRRGEVTIAISIFCRCKSLSNSAEKPKTTSIPFGYSQLPNS